MRGMIVKMLVQNGKMSEKEILHATIPPQRARGGREGLRGSHNSPHSPLTLRGEDRVYRVLVTLSKEGFIKKHGTVYRVS